MMSDDNNSLNHLFSKAILLVYTRCHKTYRRRVISVENANAHGSASKHFYDNSSTPADYKTVLVRAEGSSNPNTTKKSKVKIVKT